MKFVNAIFHSVITLIFPEFCCCCDRRGSLLCDDCYEQLNFLSLPIRLSLENSHLQGARAALQYDDMSKKLIAELKYKSVIGMGRVLGKLIYYTTNVPKTDLITAVPLHPKKKRLRGFNQAEEIAKTLAEKMRVPYAELITRKINTNSQTKTKSRTERLSALQNAFCLADPNANFTRTSILIIDDVITTGTTINECAKVLKKAGSEAIYAMTVAGKQN